MSRTIARVEICYLQDIIEVRKLARLIAETLGFEKAEQTRISTAVSEIARNVLQYGQGGEAEFLINGQVPEQWLAIILRDRGQGIANLNDILEGSYSSQTGMGLGIVGSRRLLPEYFHIETQAHQGTVVTLGRRLPLSVLITQIDLKKITETLATFRAQSPLEEIRTENHELLATLKLLHQREQELSYANQELLETNVGIIQLYSDLELKTQRLEQIEQVLRARNKDLKEFAYTVSHDLRAPLRGITGYGQELMRKHKTGLTERGQFCLSQIIVATFNLDSLIKDLLNFARLDADTPTFEDINLLSLIQTLLEDRSLIITEQSIDITLDIEFSVLQTWECGLVQVLTNLVDNAIKYSRKAKPPCIRIQTEDLGENWRLVIRDNGIGFDMKYHELIYGLFNRLQHQDEFEGTGAGLAIVKKVVDKLNGRIWAESQPGLGTAFYVELPKVESKQGSL